MRIAVLVPVRIGGSGGLMKHLRKVVSRMLQKKVVERITIVAPTRVLNGLNLPGIDVHLVSHNDYRSGFREMGEFVEAGEYDVVLCTIARPISIFRRPVVYMVRNIEPIQKASYRMTLQWRTRLWALRREQTIACRRATCIIALSEYVRFEVCRQFHIQPEKVYTVYHGFDPNETVVASKPELFTTEGGFIFSAGSMVPYRGYEDIIRALGLLQANGVNVPPVVLAGPEVGYGRSYERSLRSLAKSLKVEHFIFWAGSLESAEMTWCFQNAWLFVQTSRAESFSNIQVEAMGHGCVCVSCDHPPMPEILSDAAIYYPTGDAAALAARIKMVSQMNKNEIELRQMSALQRASFFSWDRTADQTVKVLERAVESYNGSV